MLLLDGGSYCTWAQHHRSALHAAGWGLAVGARALFSARPGPRATTKLVISFVCCHANIRSVSVPHTRCAVASQSADISIGTSTSQRATGPVLPMPVRPAAPDFNLLWATTKPPGGDPTGPAHGCGKKGPPGQAAVPSCSRRASSCQQMWGGQAWKQRRKSHQNMNDVARPCGPYCAPIPRTARPHAMQVGRSPGHNVPGLKVRASCPSPLFSPSDHTF